MKSAKEWASETFGDSMVESATRWIEAIQRDVIESCARSAEAVYGTCLDCGDSAQMSAIASIRALIPTSSPPAGQTAGERRVE